jgi:tyrosyl-tRNA synthetase
MIRKLYGDDNKACGLTINLLVKNDGSKFGKSEEGAIYLDKKYTSVFAMYQFLYNQSDADVEKLLKYFTFLNKDEIQEIMRIQQEAPFKRIAQKKLAELVVLDIHGKKEYHRCLKISDALFKGSIEALSTDELYDALSSTPITQASALKYNVIDLLVLAKVCSSKSEARKLIESNGISINGKIIQHFDQIISQEEALNKKFSYIKKGKKNYFLIR